MLLEEVVRSLSQAARLGSSYSKHFFEVYTNSGFLRCLFVEKFKLVQSQPLSFFV